MPKGTIDYHSHFIPPDCLQLEYVTERGPKVGLRHDPSSGETWMGGRLRRLGRSAEQPWMLLDDGPLTNISIRENYLDNARIDLQVISPPPYLCLYEIPAGEGWRVTRKINEGIAKAIQGSKRFKGFAAVPLQDPVVAAREAEYAVTQLGLSGVEILTHINGRNLDEPNLSVFWDTVADLGVPIFIHPHAPTDGPRQSRYYMINLIGNPTEVTLAFAHLIFGGVLDRFPKLRFILAHAGGSIPSVFGRWAHGISRIPELRMIRKPLKDYLKYFYFDTVAHDPEILKAMLTLASPEQVVLGTDYPYEMGDWDPVNTLKKVAGLGEPDRDKIAVRNLLTRRANEA